MIAFARSGNVWCLFVSRGRRKSFETKAGIREPGGEGSLDDTWSRSAIGA